MQIWLPQYLVIMAPSVFFEPLTWGWQWTFTIVQIFFPFLIGNTPGHSWFIFNLRLPEWRVESSLPSIFMMLCIFVGFFLLIFDFFFQFITRWWFQKRITPKIGEMIQFDEHTFQVGWFNHQLDQLGSNRFVPILVTIACSNRRLWLPRAWVMTYAVSGA